MGRTTIAVGMIGSSARAALWLALGALTLGAAVATRQAFAQQPATDEVATLSADALADLVGPIALYPDDLVGIVLPASTYPLQVVQAARFLDERAKNPSLKPNDTWDDSVVALLNYPEVVKLMNDDLDWTWKLGDAVISQRADVLDAIQGFRTRAAAAGNLRSDDRQVVANDGGAIAIKPADPEVIYVPYYEPERVVVYQSAPVYHYYPYAYPVYYYPYPYGYAFNSGFFWGVTTRVRDRLEHALRERLPLRLLRPSVLRPSVQQRVLRPPRRERQHEPRRLRLGAALPARCAAVHAQRRPALRRHARRSRQWRVTRQLSRRRRERVGRSAAQSAARSARRGDP